jgi:hypothetical protein
MGLYEPKREQVTRGRRKLHGEEIRDLYSERNINRRIIKGEISWDAARMGEMRTSYEILVE